MFFCDLQAVIFSFSFSEWAANPLHVLRVFCSKEVNPKTCLKAAQSGLIPRQNMVIVLRYRAVPMIPVLLRLLGLIKGLREINCSGLAACPGCIPCLRPTCTVDGLEQTPATPPGTKWVRWWMDGAKYTERSAEKRSFFTLQTAIVNKM